ncbi:MAG: nucleoside triphosphate pyrophosphohydrolase [Thermodesulfobacteriota bacterium]
MPSDPLEEFARVVHVLDRLLDPEKGCPWDLKQTPPTARLYFLEEAYEMLAAAEGDDPAELRAELGDCLFMLLFLIRLYERQGVLDLGRVLGGAADKMISRHPHVFGEGRALSSAEEVKEQWNKIKRREKKDSVLAGVPRNLPALLRAHRLTERAGRTGFDWDGAGSVLETLDQETAELKAAIGAGREREAAAELGDVLFTLANLARHLGFNAEDALRGTNDRFARRFAYIEEKLIEKGRLPEEASLKEMDELWAEAKARGL